MMRWMVKVFFALILVEGVLTESKSSYCGTKLTRILQQYCIAYPPHPSEHRTKRQIIQECCINQCTLTYLLNNYCQTINTAAMETTTLEAIIPRKRRLSKTYREYEGELQENLPQNMEERRKKRRRRKRGKRNCTCKKTPKEELKKHQIEERMKSRGPIPESRIGHIEDSPTYFIHKI